MDNFFHDYEEFEDKLGRKLEEEEQQFLQWVHERYLEEISSRSVI